MTKSELVEAIADRLKLPSGRAEAVINTASTGSRRWNAARASRLPVFKVGKEDLRERVNTSRQAASSRCPSLTTDPDEPEIEEGEDLG
jgi:nucleoid DNA-binding protein